MLRTFREGLIDYPSLPISGRRGSRKLAVLDRRAKFLETRIALSSPGKCMDFDKQEQSVLKWVIKQVIDLETRLSELEKKIPYDPAETDTPD